jgi:general secretion pathway protein F
MRYEVRTYQEDQITSIVVDAVSRTDALRQVSARALRPVGVRALDISASRWFGRFAGHVDLLLFSQELLALREAGLSIVEALDTLAEREHTGEIRSVLVQLTSRLREGKRFSDALETFPEEFPSLFVGIVRSSERTGDLSEALARYIDYRTRRNALRSKAISAAIYPSLLLVVGAAVVLFLGGYVIPRFAVVYQGSGRELPWASQMLMDWGKFASQHLGLLLICIAVALFATVVAMRSVLRRGGWRTLLHVMPAFSERIHIHEVSRLYLVLGMLLDSGLPVTHALTLAEETLPSHRQKSIQAASGYIRQGERLSAAFERENLVTPVGLRMMRLGEESGRLGEMMTRAARFHDEENTRWIERFSRVAEPTLMVAIGLVVGTIVVLLYMPVFDLAGGLR